MKKRLRIVYFFIFYSIIYVTFIVGIARIKLFLFVIGIDKIQIFICFHYDI